MKALVCSECGAARVPLEQMPEPPLPAVMWTDVQRYRVYLGNVLIAHGWLTYDGRTWRHPNEPVETFTDCAAIARELSKLRAGLRRAL